MIIESKKYNGTSSCGRTHAMTTELCVIEAGCMEHFSDLASAHGFSGRSAVIYDENTYKATAHVHPKADKEIILPPEELHADNHGVALAMEQLPTDCDYLVAIGSGTIHDITRYLAYTKGIPFISCPTAASVDGFCSSVAAMTWDGFKKTFTAVAPRIVIADLRIISKAPMFLTKSGFGDMLGKFIALADWRIAHTLTGEYFCDSIYELTRDAAQAVVESAEGIRNGELRAYESLTYGLLMSGLAMQLLGNSRCASGAEHHISHFIEMQPATPRIRSTALHGEKVGVGTLLACREYHRLCRNKDIFWRDYPDVEKTDIDRIFGERLSRSIIEENAHNCASGITAKAMEEHWGSICDTVSSIPAYEKLLETYETLGLKSELCDIGVPEEALDLLLEYSPLVRNRVTLMRLRRAIKTKE